MNANQVKDEIRKLNRIDKIEIYRWIDEEAASDFISGIVLPGNRSEGAGDPAGKGGVSSLINTE